MLYIDNNGFNKVQKNILKPESVNIKILTG